MISFQVFDQHSLASLHPCDPPAGKGNRRLGLANEHSFQTPHLLDLRVNVVHLETEVMQAAAFFNELGHRRFAA